MGRSKQDDDIEAYVDAVKAKRALLRAQELEGRTEDRDRLLKKAGVRVVERMRCLTGGQIGQAQRMLKELTP